MLPVRFPWDIAPAPVPVAEPSDEDLPTKKTPRGRRPAASRQLAAQDAAAVPDWLYHHLTVSGPVDAVAAFAAAARGSGVIPWRLDFADVEETVFTLAVAQPAGRRTLTVEGCRILARQFRDKVEAHQARAAALVGNSLACPFDLHRLLPVPDSILQLGPAHPDALAWLAAQWGVGDRLRQVMVRENATAGRRLPRGHTVIGYGFFTGGDTPHTAVSQLAARWPALRLVLQPRPAD
jgi:hypothetical protein